MEDVTGRGAEALANPILNTPYDQPGKHFVIGPRGRTGAVKEGRRPSESFIPIAAPRKGRVPAAQATGAEQEAFDFDATGERREANSLINDIRYQVGRWRNFGYQHVTPLSRKLLWHWAAGLDERADRMLFCQREAAETAIYLTEVAGRHGEPDFRIRLDEANAQHNAGLPRMALKMATGTGKTVVMAMLIAWQTINKVATPRDARFAKRFLVVTPGITIRDRLRVLDPTEAVNYYRERDLVPADLWGYLNEVQLLITNYHAFLLRDAPEIRGVARNTRALLRAGKGTDPFTETEEAMVARVLRTMSGGRDKGGLVVLNDEAHHCYQDRPLSPGGPKASRDDKARNENARVWFRGLQAVARHSAVKAVFDLSATPFYLSGSGYNEGYIFPWTVSDFSLMDAIESGIVKVPQVPVDDDAAGEKVTYLRLWDAVGKQLPKRSLKSTRTADGDDGKEPWDPPEELEGALESLHKSYRRRFAQWETILAPQGEPPPVMIVVCPNTVVSKLVYDWIAGEPGDSETGRVARPGRLDLLSNVVDGRWLARPRTILIDSAALEAGDAMSTEFKAAAAAELESFKAEYRLRNPGADVAKISDEDLMREVMNTVGKRGKLGEQVRCVVSVSMLTEGWDANTVSHILGIRAFRSQLLCEQVVGRGLRRRSYAPNDAGFFEPEYAEVYGVPFAFIPSDHPVPDPTPAPPATEVYAVAGREDLEIRFPKLAGYRAELPEDVVIPAFDADAKLHLSRNEVALWTRSEAITGGAEEVDLTEYRQARPQQVAYKVAARLAKRFSPLPAPGEVVAAPEAEAAVGASSAGETGTGDTGGDDPERNPTAKPWLFPTLVAITKRWLAECVTCDPDVPIGMLLTAEATARAAERLFGTVMRLHESRDPVLLPQFRPFDRWGSTAEVSFVTRKATIPATKSQVSHVVLDGVKGNTWEENVAEICEHHDRVHAYVKNDHLGFDIPYVHEGKSHNYRPDFLVRLVPLDDHDLERTLIVEVSGGQKSLDATAAKARTARDVWCTAVNDHGGFGLWGYVELTLMDTAARDLNAAIELLTNAVPPPGAPTAAATKPASTAVRA